MSYTNKKLNIAVLHFHRLGGSGIIAYEIARSMVKRGHKVHFVGLKPPLRFVDYDSETSLRMFFHKIELVEYHVFDYQPYDLALASQLAEVIDKYEIDIIHCHYAIPHTLVAFLARSMVKRKVKIITTLHGTDITMVAAHPSMLGISRFGLQRSDAVVTVSNYLKNKTEEILAVKNIKTIYNFVSDDFFPQFHEPCPKKDNEERWVLHSSNLREVKAPLDVVSLFMKMIRLTGKNLRLVFAGNGPLRGSIEARARAFGIADRITFLGEVVDVKAVYSRACFFLLPSYEEAFGLSALEAMAFGIPVLASRAGGLPEVIEDGVDGFLFADRDLDEGARKISQAILDPEVYLRISKAARKTAEEKFPMSKAIEQYEELYRGNFYTSTASQTAKLI